MSPETDSSVTASGSLTPASLGRLRRNTPFLACDNSVVEDQYAGLRLHLPGIEVHYAVKCNPAAEVLATLAARGCQFEVASIHELMIVEATGTSASAVLFSNPVKPPAAVAEAHGRGLYRFAMDSEGEVRKLAVHAPGSSVYVRLAVDDSHSLFPLSRKFGVSLDEAERLLLLSRTLGLVPYGVAFHVGSQCTDPGAWPRAIGRCGVLLERMVTAGITLEMLNIGGGFPAHYTESTPSLESIAGGIRSAIDRLSSVPDLVVAEPGRFLVAASAVMVASVIGLATRSDGPWAYLDVGGYNGLMEPVQTGGHWQFPLQTSRPDVDADLMVAFTLTGPTCDASDTMFYDALLPATLEPGDRVYIGMAGAYTLSYASSFNGFFPPDLIFVRTDRPA